MSHCVLSWLTPHEWLCLDFICTKRATVIVSQSGKLWAVATTDISALLDLLDIPHDFSQLRSSERYLTELTAATWEGSAYRLEFGKIGFTGRLRLSRSKWHRVISLFFLFNAQPVLWRTSLPSTSTHTTKIGKTFSLNLKNLHLKIRKGVVHLKIEILSIYYRTQSRWRLWWHFLINIT